MRNPYWKGEVALADRPTNPGQRLARVYEPIFNGATTVLRLTGTKDIQASMDAMAPYCDIRYMLNQLKVGDTSVLSAKPAMYGDFSGLPNNPADVINLVNGAESSFGQLPAETRAAFNNDWRLWFADKLRPRQSISAVDNDTDNSVEVNPVES